MSEVKTILMLSANPKETTQLRLGEENSKLQKALERSKCRDRFNLEQRWAVTTTGLRRALLDFQPHILHFSGHGVGGRVVDGASARDIEVEGEASSKAEGLVLEDEQGLSKIVGGEAIAELLSLVSDNLECVVLNSCYSQVQADVIRQHVPYVVGMRQKLGDSAAIQFTQGFYDGLFAGKGFDKAFGLGRNSIQLDGIPEHLTPVLRMNKALVRGMEARLQAAALAQQVEVAEAKAEEQKRSVGDSIDARGSQGFVNRAERPVNIQFGNSSVVNTGGGDYAGRDLYKSSGGSGEQASSVGAVLRRVCEQVKEEIERAEVADLDDLVDGLTDVRVALEAAVKAEAQGKGDRLKEKVASAINTLMAVTTSFPKLKKLLIELQKLPL